MRYSVLESEILFRGFFQVERSSVRWEQHDGSMGSEQTRYVIRRGDSVGILPECRNSGRVVLVQQFRYPAAGKGSDGYLWEIPAGMVGEGEEPDATARRELMEEIGVRAEEFAYLSSFFLSPGLLDEKFHLFRAGIPECDAMAGFGGNKREHEDLRIQAFSREELLAMIAGNRFCDAKTIASLLFHFFIADRQPHRP
jgi:ADP-ribose pyrophosphatase